MLYKTKKSKLYSTVAFVFSFILYVSSLILTYRYVEYFLNPYVAPIILFFNFILMVISFNQANFTINPPKFILRRKKEDENNYPNSYYKFELTAYSGDKDDVNIFIKDIELDLSSNLNVFMVSRGNNMLNFKTVGGDRNRRKFTQCEVNDHADVNTKFLVTIVPNSTKPEDVNRLEIRIVYEKRFWFMKVTYLESHTVKAG